MTNMWKVRWILTLTLVFCLFGQLYAQDGPGMAPDSLFQGVDLDTLPLSPKAKQMIDVIQNRPYNKGMKPVKVKNIKGNLLQSPELHLEIPGDTVLKFKQRLISWQDSTKYTWRGYSADSLYRLKMVKSNGQLTGSFSSDTAKYRIRPISFVPTGAQGNINLHVITKVDASGISLIDSLRQQPKTKSNGSRHIKDNNDLLNVSLNTTTNQGIMVLYTNHVSDEVADPQALAQSAVDDANSAYQNSGISVELTMVHSQEIDYDGSGDTDTDLQRLQDPNDGLIDTAHQLRAQYGADMVVLLTTRTQSGDNGTVTGEAYEIMADSTTAFAVVRYDFAEAPIYTLAHEIGHLQGADHNPGDEINPYKSYGHGYVNEQEGWRTVMAYNVNGCCSRIEFFSTPDVTYNGNPLGTDSESDNARLITETASTVADFLPPYPLDAEIQGPSFVHEGHSATWEADVSGGQQPYSYRWYKRYSTDENWNQVSDTASYSQRVQDDFELKLTTSDDNGDTKETIFMVYTNVKSSLSEADEHPKSYTLSSNYPNPFNPSTRFQYQLPEASYVEIEVYTISGQQVRTLKEGYQNSGTYSLKFDASNLSSGLYLLRMHARSKDSGNRFTKTVKMTLMK